MIFSFRIYYENYKKKKSNIIFFIGRKKIKYNYN